MKIRSVIVDDEALARSRIRKLLTAETDIEVIGECENGPDAIRLMQEQRPDLAFLDVQMPEISGFDVLRALPAETWPAIIFVTAHDQHAIAAFEVHALDFLLKPFTQTRFQEAVHHAREHLQRRDFAAINQRLLESLNAAKSEPAYLSRIAVKTGERTIFVRMEEIDYLESAANYVVLHAGAQNHIVRETLTNLEARLSPKSFLRISRSLIVNLERIKELQPALRGEYVIVLNDNRHLTMTRGLREVQERLQYS